MLKTKTSFAHPITKPPASTLELKNFDSILRKNFVTPDKNGKSAPTPLAPPVPGQAYDLGRYFAKFPEFFKTQCWQPWSMVSVYLVLNKGVIRHLPIEITFNFTLSYVGSVETQHSSENNLKRL